MAPNRLLATGIIGFVLSILGCRRARRANAPLWSRVEGDSRLHYVFAWHGDGLETSPDGLLGAGVPGRRDGAAYAVEHGRDRHDRKHRNGRLRLSVPALYRTYAELPRSTRLYQRIGAADLAGHHCPPGRVDITRLPPPGAATRRHLR